MLRCGEAVVVSIQILPPNYCLSLDADAFVDTDEKGLQPRKFFIPVQSTLRSLLAREDTDGNMQITIDDDGPKVSARCSLQSEC